jgi:hypothetical protein
MRVCAGCGGHATICHECVEREEARLECGRNLERLAEWAKGEIARLKAEVEMWKDTANRLAAESELSVEDIQVPLHRWVERLKEKK